jgi:hypothetical protein
LSVVLISKCPSLLLQIRENSHCHAQSTGARRRRAVKKMGERLTRVLRPTEENDGDNDDASSLNSKVSFHGRLMVQPTRLTEEDKESSKGSKGKKAKQYRLQATDVSFSSFVNNGVHFLDSNLCLVYHLSRLHNTRQAGLHMLSGLIAISEFMRIPQTMKAIAANALVYNQIVWS